MILNQVKNAFSCSNRRGVYACGSLRAFAMSMVEIFVPIHLYVSGFSFKEIALFLIVNEISAMLYSVIGMKTISKFGFSKCYVLSFIPVCIYFILLASIKEHNISLYLLPLLGQFSVFYWLFHHISLTKYTQEGARNSQVVMLQTLTSITKIIGPVLGGIILTYLSMNYLVGVVLFILGLSAIYMSRVENTKEVFSFAGLKKSLKETSARQLTVYGARGMNKVFISKVWPLLAFTLFLNDYILLGLSITLMSLASIFAGHFASSAFDKNERLGLRIGASGLSVVWIIRMFAIGPLGVFITNVFEGVLEKLTATSFNALSYGVANKSKSIAHNTVVREVCLHFATLIMVILLYFSSDWVSLLPLAAIGSFLYFLF